MTEELQIKPTFKTAKLLHQALISGAILLTALGVHQALNWREAILTQVQVGKRVRLSVEDQQLARTAWRYFQNNRLSTGLVSSAADFPATTMWDVGSQLAGMVAARELGFLSQKDFDTWMKQTLTSLAKLPLYKGELPNKAYNAQRLIPVNYGKLDTPEQIGFSSLDIGRLARWLDIIAARYPQHAAATKAVTKRWKLQRLVKYDQLIGADARSGKEVISQEGRLGYEQYSAYGLTKLGLSPKKALDFKRQTEFVNVMGVGVPADKRTTYHNYVTSEPYILDGLESGFKALPINYAARVLQAQQYRYQKTNQLTAWSEDNIDQAPWFVYNNIYVDGQPWKTIDASGNDAGKFRGSSVKAATAWNVLFRNAYTEKVYKGMRWLGDPSRGVFAGFYEETQQPNRALTVNTNGIVLESLLYSHVGMPLEVWARQRNK